MCVHAHVYPKRTKLIYIISNKSNVSIPFPCSKMGLKGQGKCQVSVQPANRGTFSSPVILGGPKRHLAGRREMINYGLWVA